MSNQTTSEETISKILICRCSSFIVGFTCCFCHLHIIILRQLPHPTEGFCVHKFDQCSQLRDVFFARNIGLCFSGKFTNVNKELKKGLLKIFFCLKFKTFYCTRFITLTLSRHMFH